MKRPGTTLRVLAVVAVAAMATALAPVVAQAQTPVGNADFSASATGSLVHADLLEVPGTRLVDTEVGWSSAATDSNGLSTLRDEMGNYIVPKDVKTQSYASGQAVSLTLGGAPGDPSQLNDLAQLSEAKTGDQPVTHSLGDSPIDADPLAYVDLLYSHAEANDAASQCTIGKDLTQGNSHVADVQLLDTDGAQGNPPGLEAPVLTLDAPNPDRAVANSISHTRLVPNGKGAFGIMGETRETVAPITLFKGTENEVTIEVLGEWVLRATDLGNGPTVHYGPADDSPDTPVVRIIQNGAVQEILKLQDITDPLHDNGILPIDIPGQAGQPSLAQLDLGQAPRKLADGHWAVDVASVKLLNVPEQFKLAEVRVGHMEVSAHAPSGGIDCPVSVNKTSNPASVTAGDQFTTTITVNNTYDAPMKNVRILDSITQDPNVKWSIVSTDPSTSKAVKDSSDTTTYSLNGDNGQVLWEGLGPIAPGKSLTVKVTFDTDGSGAGSINDTAHVAADIASANAQGKTTVATLVGSGNATTTVGAAPQVKGETVSAEQTPLPRTGGGNGPLALGLGALALAGLAYTVSRRRLAPWMGR